MTSLSSHHVALATALGLSCRWRQLATGPCQSSSTSSSCAFDRWSAYQGARWVSLPTPAFSLTALSSVRVFNAVDRPEASGPLLPGLSLPRRPPHTFSECNSQSARKLAQRCALLYASRRRTLLLSTYCYHDTSSSGKISICLFTRE